MINKKSKIFVAGHKGMVGSAIVRKLKKKGFSRIIFAEKKNSCDNFWCSDGPRKKSRGL